MIGCSNAVTACGDLKWGPCMFPLLEAAKPVFGRTHDFQDFQEPTVSLRTAMGFGNIRIECSFYTAEFHFLHAR